MADLFDQFEQMHAAPKAPAGGDLFDQFEQQQKATPSAASPAPQAAPAAPPLQAVQPWLQPLVPAMQAGVGAVRDFSRAANQATSQGISNLQGFGERLGGLLNKAIGTGESTLEDEARNTQVNAQTGQGITQRNQAIQAMPQPVNPQGIPAIAGQAAGAALPIVLSGPAATATMVAGGHEQGLEEIAAREKATGQPLTLGQKAAFLGGNAATNLIAGQAMPSGLLGEGISSLLPGAGRVGRTLAQGALGAGEMAGLTAAQNTLANATGVDPDRPTFQGGAAAAAQGFLQSGIHQAVREAGAPKAGPEAAQKTPPTSKPEEKFGPKSDQEMNALMRAAEAKRQADILNPKAEPTPAPEANPLKSAREQHMEKLQQFAHEQNQPIPEFTPGLHPEETPVDTFKQQKEQRPSTTVGEVLKGNKATKNLSDETLRVPVHFADNLGESTRGHYVAGFTDEAGKESEPYIKAAHDSSDEELVHTVAHEAAHNEREMKGRSFQEGSPENADIDEYNRQPEEISANRLGDFAEKNFKPMKAKFEAEHPSVFQKAAAEKAGPQPNESIRDVAKSDADKAGIAHGTDTEYAKVDEGKAKQIAADYDAMKHEPNNPKVKASYDAMKRETLAQYQHLKDQGYKFTPEENPPHRTAGEIHDDLAQNKHLGVYTGGDMPADHPLAEAAPENPDGLKTYNDLFRAVHDVFGHAKEGYGFGPRGEENAWRQHVQMYSPEARGAVTAETRGQNSWVNFGPHGEENRANPAETKYAEQKAGLLPEESTLFKRMADKVKSLGSEESGTAPFVEKFAKESVAPTVEASAKGITDAWRGIRQTFGGQVGKDVWTAKKTLKHMFAERAQRGDIVNDRLIEAERNADKLTPDQQKQMTYDYEAGRKQADPKMQTAIEVTRDMLDDRLAQIQARDPDFKGLPDYLGHAYKDPTKATNMISEWQTRRPLAGNRDYAKRRAFPTQEEANKAGLENRSDNLFTTQKAKLGAMDKWITAFDARKVIDDAGLLKDEPANGRVPDGFAKIGDPMFRGKIVPEEVASVLHNALSPGVMSNKDFGGVLRGVRTVGNTMNQASLGVSAIHATTSSINSDLSEFASGLRDIVPLIPGIKGEAHPIRGAAKLANATSFIGPVVRDYLKGSFVKDIWLHPETATPEQQHLIETLKNDGGRAMITHDYMTNATDKMMKAFRGGNVIAGALRVPFAAIEQAAKPIMEHMVPKLKAGAWVRIYQDTIAAHPTATPAETSDLMGNAWKSIDNRFGEMVHDNRFWNNTARQVAQLGLRSVGWNYGTADELVGAGYDTLKGGKDLLSGKGAEFTHRMAYAVALPALTYLWGAMANYALTGHGPRTISDAYNIPSGHRDKDGKEIRFQLPTYMKDVQALKHDPLGTLANKAHPLISNVIEMMKNKDYYGDKIIHEDDKGTQIMADLAKHFGESYSPLSVRNMLALHNEGDSLKRQIGTSLMGISKAPKWMSTSDAEQEAYKPIQAASEGREGRTTQAQTKHDLTTALRNKKPNSAEDIQDALKSGSITAKDAMEIRKNAQKPGGLKGALESRELDARYLMDKVWPKMTPQEIKDNQFVIRRKLASADANPEDKQKWFQTLNEAVKK